MKKLIIAISMAMAVSVHAETLEGGYGACVSADLFDQFISAAVKNDVRAFSYLLKNGCIITRDGINISVLDKTWTGIAKVRAYSGDASIILWTNAENISK